jgi:acetyl esterase/lipase
MRSRIASLMAGLLLAGWFAGNNQGLSQEKSSGPDSLTVIRDIQYCKGASKSWYLDLAMKNDLRGKSRPGIVVIHGGGWLEGDRSTFATSKHGTPGNIEDFAELGFVAVTINYRLSGEAPFPAALEDCQCAVRWLRAHARDYNLDPKQIGAFGNSAGGHLALLLGMVGKEKTEGDVPYAEESSAIQAVVSDSGPVDLLAQYQRSPLKEVVSKFLGGPPEGERAALYKKASPIHHVGKDTPPLLLIYGGADEQVPVESADRFVLALGQAGLKDISYQRLAYVDHCPCSLVRVASLRSVVNEFFLRVLMYPDTARQIKRRPDPR